MLLYYIGKVQVCSIQKIEHMCIVITWHTGLYIIHFYIQLFNVYCMCIAHTYFNKVYIRKGDVLLYIWRATVAHNPTIK